MPLELHRTAPEDNYIEFRVDLNSIYLINGPYIYQNAALSKEPRCDAFINCVISICFYIISASLALWVRGGVFADFVLLSFFQFLRV